MDDKLLRIRHTSAHILAAAVLELYPDAKLGTGPARDNGFWYDFDLPMPLKPEELAPIETVMRRIIKEDLQMVYREVTTEEARKLFANQPYKLEKINDILEGAPDENLEGQPSKPVLSTYRCGKFEDLCKGPHVSRTGEVPVDAFRVLRCSNAYWKDDESRPMLRRVFGTAFASAEDMAADDRRRAELDKRDHRELGKQLDLFSTAPDWVGPGLVLWHPKGAMVRYLFERFSAEAHQLNGYQLVYTPHIGRARLWETSGHLRQYKDMMYSPLDIDGDLYYLKPMNCPFHIQIYNSRPRSFRELPMRLAEFGTVYRYEKSGVLTGLSRVRGFTQDDAHTFCTLDQVEGEIRHALRFSLYVLRSFGLKNFKAYLATKPAGNKATGSDEGWAMATETLRKILVEEKIPYTIDEGGGAFYGPKIDLKVLDTLDREIQLSTVQFDFNLPVAFGMTYIGTDGKEQRPYMVHRALFGSAERFLSMLVENYAGAFPLWLAPVQAKIVPVTDKQNAYAQKVKETLQAAGMRAEADERAETMQSKIRDAQMEKIPFILVVGAREERDGQISVRERVKGNLGAVTIKEFLESTQKDRDIAKPSKLP
jgi:threonyl-tRNA synthetase